jgi:hypothetical protein
MSGLGFFFLVSSHVMYYGERLSACLPTPNLENQVSISMTPGDREGVG